MTQFNRVNSNDELFVRTFEQDKSKLYEQHYKRLNDVIREVSKNRQVDLIDLATLIPSSSDYIYDVFHLNEQGSELVAETLTSYWIEKLKLKRKNLVK